MTKKNYYDVLQVSQNADPEIITAAYKSLVQRHHPDKNPNNPGAEKYLKIINRAYEVLSDPLKRAGYDAALVEDDEFQPNQAKPPTYAEEGTTKENNSGSANGSSPSATPEAEKHTSTPRPWIRYWARAIDYVVWSVIVGLTIGYLNGSGTISNHTALGLTNPFILSILVVFTWALVEPIVIALFGTTVGKTLLMVRLTHKSNEKLSKVGLGMLYQRSMAIWLKGMGAGLPFVSWITALISYSKLKSRGKTSWDRNGGFIVTHGNVGYIRGSLATIIIVFAIILNGVGFKDYQNREALARKNALALPPLDMSYFAPPPPSGLKPFYGELDKPPKSVFDELGIPPPKAAETMGTQPFIKPSPQ